jgi:hypothetical protein
MNVGRGLERVRKNFGESDLNTRELSEYMKKIRIYEKDLSPQNRIPLARDFVSPVARIWWPVSLRHIINNMDAARNQIDLINTDTLY